MVQEYITAEEEQITLEVETNVALEVDTDIALEVIDFSFEECYNLDNN